MERRQPRATFRRADYEEWQQYCQIRDELLDRQGGPYFEQYLQLVGQAIEDALRRGAHIRLRLSWVISYSSDSSAKMRTADMARLAAEEIEADAQLSRAMRMLFLWERLETGAHAEWLRRQAQFDERIQNLLHIPAPVT